MKDRLQVDDDERGPPTTRDRNEEGSGATRHTEQNRAHERVDKLQCVYTVSCSQICRAPPPC